MCLNISRSRCAEFLLKSPEIVTCYKKISYFASRTGAITLYSPHRTNFKWKSGWKHAKYHDGRSVLNTIINTIDTYTVDEAIHVYRNQRAAERYSAGRVVIKLTALRKDILGVSSGQDLAFRKVFFSPEEYKRVIALIKKKEKLK